MTLDYAQMAMAIAIGEALVLFALVQLGFRIIKHYIKRIASLESEIKSLIERHQKEIDQAQERHDRLVHYRDRTIVEDTMVALERESKATNFRHEQEMMSSFNTMRSLLDKYTTLLERYLGYDVGRPVKEENCFKNNVNPQDVEMF